MGKYSKSKVCKNTKKKSRENEKNKTNELNAQLLQTINDKNKIKQKKNRPYLISRKTPKEPLPYFVKRGPSLNQKNNHQTFKRTNNPFRHEPFSFNVSPFDIDYNALSNMKNDIIDENQKSKKSKKSK